MEFFDWMGIPQAILSFFNFSVDETVESILNVQRNTLVITLWVTLGLYLLGHVFGGVGLYTMAKKRGDKLAWMAFLPFLNTYLSGRLAGETNIFGVKCKRLGLYAAILEFVYVAINTFTLTVSMLLMRPSYYEIVTTQYGTQTYLEAQLAISQIPMRYRWMPTTYNVMNIIGIVWYFITLAAFIFLYMAFFRKYYARSPMVMAFLCSIFPVRGYVFFAVRNNTPVDYNAWMQERIRRMQQQQAQQYGYPPYGGPQQPYNGPQQPYGGPQQPPYGGDPQGGQGEPFSDFGDRSAPSDSDDPFSDL